MRAAASGQQISLGASSDRTEPHGKTEAVRAGQSHMARKMHLGP